MRAQVSVFGFSATFFLRPQAPDFAPWLRNVQRLYRLVLKRADRVAIGGLLGLYHASITGMDALGAHLRALRPLLDDSTVPPFQRLVGGLSDVIHHWIAGSTDDALARLAAYSHLASATGAHAIDRQFVFHHVYVHCLRGELAEAERHLQSLAPQLTQLGQIDVAQFHFLSGWHAALAGRTGEAVHLLEVAYSNARARRFALFEACSRGLLAELLATAGDTGAARRHAEGALQVALGMGSVTARVACQMQCAAVAELAGDSAATLAPLITRAFGDARQHGHWAWGGLYPPTLARLAARALALGVEEGYARELIRRRGLASDPTFGTPPASGAYNPANDPKLRYDNPLTGATAANNLAQQFQVVARLIDAGLRGTSGCNRQVFFVSMGGFDTHDFQNRNQADLMARLAHAMSYFDDTLGNLNARAQVTTFTASDFGRTFTSNGDGTDHGWGSHHFVMGGAVRGGQTYGRVPLLAVKNTNNNNFDGSPDQLGNGSLLPQISVDQLGNTLGRWLGLSDAALLDIFPNLANFDPGVRNLGFLNA